MKRSHRRWHRVVWPIVALAAAMAVGAALAQRSSVPANAAWPPTLPAVSR